MVEPSFYALSHAEMVRAHVYTAHDLAPILKEEMVQGGTGGCELAVLLSPVFDMEFEMDAGRYINHETTLIL